MVRKIQSVHFSRPSAVALRSNAEARSRLMSSIRHLGHWPMRSRPVLANNFRKLNRVRTAGLTKRKYQKGTPLPNRSGSESVYKIKLKPVGLLAKIEKKLPTSTYTYNIGAVVDGTTSGGWQTNFEFSPINMVADLGNMVAEAALTNVDPTVQNKTTRIFVKSCKQEIAIQNSSNAIVRVILYNFIAKRDGYGNQDGHTCNGLNNWQDGTKDQTTSGTSTTYNIVGSKPTDSRMFNAYFKVKKVTFIDLAPGQVHYHRVSYGINREIAQEWLAPTGLNVIKGWYLGTLLATYGEPVADNSSGVTTSKVKLNTIVTKSYRYSWLQNSESFSLQTNNLSTVPAGTFENMVTGASATYAPV